MIKKAICPNCGAEGTVGRYCEFCGTKIPAPIVNQTANSKPKEHRPRIVRFSITKDDAIELFFNYLYKKGVSFENINLTVVNIKTYSIPFIAYNVYYEYYWTGENEDGTPDNGTLKGEKKLSSHHTMIVFKSYLRLIAIVYSVTAIYISRNLSKVNMKPTLM